MSGLRNASYEKSWRRIDAAYGELTLIREFLVRIRGGRLRKLARYLRIMKAPDMEFPALEELAFLEEDITRMRTEYAQRLTKRTIF